MGTAGAPKNLRTGPHTKDQTLQGNEGRYDVKKEKREKSIRFTLYTCAAYCVVWCTRVVLECREARGKL